MHILVRASENFEQDLNKENLLLNMSTATYFSENNFDIVPWLVFIISGQLSLCFRL